MIFRGTAAWPRNRKTDTEQPNSRSSARYLRLRQFRPAERGIGRLSSGTVPCDSAVGAVDWEAVCDLARIIPGRNHFVVSAIHVNPLQSLELDQIRRTDGSLAALPSKPDLIYAALSDRPVGPPSRTALSDRPVEPPYQAAAESDRERVI